MTGRFDVSLRRGLIRLFEGGFKRRPVFRYWRELELSQWLAPDALEQLRTERLQRFMLSVERDSPWYRAEWQRLGLRAAELHTVDDLARWPMITRETIAQHREAMRSTRPGTDLIAKATGGSSGVPLRFDLDFDSNERRMAAWHRGYDWAGAAPGTRQWYLWGVPPDSTAGWRKKKGGLYDRLYRRTIESCFNLSEARVPSLAASLIRTRPDAIVAYTGALHTFAKMLEEQRIVPFSPAAIVVGAEKLHQFQRDKIEQVFRAPVYETYGSREFMLMGAECEHHSGLHLTAENHIIELLDDNGNPVAEGTEGDIVVTDLTNRGMPFIRYRNGDRGVMAAGSCACGRSLPRLAKVTGRRLDILTAPDGRALPGEFFPHILKEFSSVRQFQVEQVATDHLTMRLVAPEWTTSDTERLQQEIQAATGAPLDIRIELVDSIPLTGSGKLMVVINRLSSQYPSGGSSCEQ